jgi:general secretion pathway protein J
VSLKAENQTSSQGFTLLELLISLSIMAVMVVIIFGAFRVGVRAWEKGERDLESQHRRRVVLELIKRQLASMVRVEEREKEEGEKNIFELRGQSKSVSFVSRTPVVPSNSYGKVYVEYRVEEEEESETESLLIYERNIALLDPEEDPPEPDREDYYELLSGKTSISFEYLASGGEESLEWEPSWDPEDHADKRNPQAVRLTLQTDEKTFPLVVIARMETVSDEKGLHAVGP